MRRAKPWIITLIVLAVLALVADRGGQLAVERIAAGSMQDALSTPGRPEVDLGGFPFLPELISQRFDDVTVDMVIEYLNKNVRNAQLILKDAVQRVAAKETPYQFREAIKNAIFTAPDHWPVATAKKLDAIIGKYGPK